MDSDARRRNLQIEARAHVRLQAEIDRQHAGGQLPDPVSTDFVRWLHREFYEGASAEMLRIEGRGTVFQMTPGQFRIGPEQEVEVGNHRPPSPDRLDNFMAHFASRYRQDRLGASGKIMAIAAAHHRFNYIHPFPDGNGRVSRLMSHAMCLKAGIGAHGLWSISRGLARGRGGTGGRAEYMEQMDAADAPRQGDLDGRGNLSHKALLTFIEWFLQVCLDQVSFMTRLFDLGALENRMAEYVRVRNWGEPAYLLLREALRMGEFARGEAPRITRLGDRKAREILSGLTEDGILASDTPKGPVRLHFIVDAMDVLFPRLFTET